MEDESPKINKLMNHKLQRKERVDMRCDDLSGGNYLLLRFLLLTLLVFLLLGVVREGAR